MEPADGPVSVSGGIQSPHPQPLLRHSAASRAFLRLLRVCALIGGTSRGERLYSAFVFILITAGVAFNVSFAVWRGGLMLREMGFVEAAAKSGGMFGMTDALMWVPSVACLCGGRRRYGALLLTLERRLGPLVGRSGYRPPAQHLRREVNWLLAIAAALILFSAAVSVAIMLTLHNEPAFFSSLSTIEVAILVSLFFVYSSSFHLTPLKFVFAGVHVSSGLRFINEELRADIDHSSQLTPVAIDHLLALHDDLSKAFTSLTTGMYYELLVCMLYGTISSIYMWLLLVLTAPSGVVSQYALMITQYVVGAETVGRDLDTFGDLGLFRLQRSTVLSISATILTYIIVLVQFYDAPVIQALCQAINGTAHPPN
ncbi:hypothetical protein FJT64_025141 [Amphibalanus amphitrite]|uniref:Gustatory receptor n=1 Tax=Amphibalanus amphitrite TaxID=1232801 RepID=A0A6A4WC96_AMPAM|nr:hypothetical protein FJT64_025141 [Amphibalanus amphitrite]